MKELQTIAVAQLDGVVGGGWLVWRAWGLNGFLSLCISKGRRVLRGTPLGDLTTHTPLR